MKRHHEEVAEKTLRILGEPDPVLVRRLGNVFALADSEKRRKAFRRPPGAKETAKQLDSLTKALARLRTSIDKLDPIIFREVNRELFEGDIPLLDEIHSRLGFCQTQAPRDIAVILYELSEALSRHVESIPRKDSPSGANNDFTRFLASELSTVYAHATRTRATASEGFYNFVNQVLIAAKIDRLKTETVVRLATAKEKDSTPIHLIGG